LAALSTSQRAAQAQRPIPVIGFLGTETPDVFGARIGAFRRGLNETGYIEGRNVELAFQWAGGNHDLLRTLADELVRQRVSLLVSGGTTAAALAAKAATTTIPIVFFTGGDPVDAGLVAGLARPGGNLTGVTSLSRELATKQFELLHEMIPAQIRIAMLVKPDTFRASNMKSVEAAAQALGLNLHVLYAATEREFEAAILKVVQLGAVGLVIGADPLFSERAEQLGALSVHYGIPAIAIGSDFATAGGLMSYGGSLSDLFRVVGVYAGRILNGEKPADLPVQQVTKIKLTINLKTAKRLGIEVPTGLLVRADEVIE
jgi:putative ABC transport system substrate-binding protein